MQALALQKAQLEVEELRSKIALNNAKAAEAQSNKDKKDLDYVEQETGTTHARDMQKQRGQAQGNQDLEVTKALLRPRKQANGAETQPDLEGAVGWGEVSDQLRDDGQPDRLDIPPQLGGQQSF